MLIKDIQKARKLRKTRLQPGLPFLRFPLLENLQAIRERCFPNIRVPVEVCFVCAGPLACICVTDKKAVIYVHQVLNQHRTPPTVMDLIHTHELLHLEIPSRQVNGRKTDHPPEFVAKEKLLCLRRDEAWNWIARNLWSCLKIRRRLERIDVLKNWMQTWQRLQTHGDWCYESVPAASRSAMAVSACF